jgi:hypothetical protein
MALKDGSIAELLNSFGVDKLMISPTPHSRTQIRMELVRWVAEAKRPFSIVEDPGFVVLMKTGRTHLYLPSAKTVSRDTRAAFVFMRREISMLLKVCL